jgi:hypothetical protein
MSRGESRKFSVEVRKEVKLRWEDLEELNKSDDLPCDYSVPYVFCTYLPQRVKLNLELFL